MHKQNVFVVTGRHLVDGVPRGAIETVVVCAEGEKGVRKFLGHRLPELGITTITGLMALENRVKKIKAALTGEEREWPVLVDPALEEQEGTAP